MKLWKKTTNKTVTRKIVTIIRKSIKTIRKTTRTTISADTDYLERSMILAQNKEWPGKYIYSKPFFVLK